MTQARTKFRCVSVKKYKSTFWDTESQANTGGFLYAYEFQVVTGDTPENREFFASTPTGSLQLHAVRNDLFEPGDLYFLDFTFAGSGDNK